MKILNDTMLRRFGDLAKLLSGCTLVNKSPSLTILMAIGESILIWTQDNPKCAEALQTLLVEYGRLKRQEKAIIAMRDTHRKLDEGTRELDAFEESMSFDARIAENLDEILGAL